MAMKSFIGLSSVPPESQTLGSTHLQFGALLTAARESPSPYYFALVVMLGLVGLRIFEATLVACGSRGRTFTCSATPTSQPCSTRAWACEMSGSMPGDCGVSDKPRNALSE